MSDDRAAKRPRSQSNDTSEGATTRKIDEEFWYEDGSVILVAGDVEFRVFRGILAEYSPVFKDTFSLPQPPLPVGQGPVPCPVIHLSDSSDDLRALLRVCMPTVNSNPFTHDTEEPSYETIAGSIRLGHKYQIYQVVDHALEYLKRYYTDEYAQWKAHHRKGPAHFQSMHAIGVVNLARLTGCQTILPTALYQCCQLGKGLVAGFDRGDGTRECLSAEDLTLCLLARAALIKESVAMALRICAPTLAPTCTGRAHCTRLLNETLNTGVLNPAAVCKTRPLGSFGSLFNGLKNSLCCACFSMLCERDGRERRELWARLPSVLGLTMPGWSGGAAEARQH